MKLKKKDSRMLFELDLNYRRPYSRIGKKIKMSQQMISYRVKSMVSDGAIQGYYPLVDYSRFGCLNFRVYFKINYVSKERFAELIKKISDHKNITRVMECDGRYDLLTVFAAKNPSSFNKMFRELIESNQKQLKNYVILTTVVEHYYSRNYLGGKTERDTIIGGDREEVKIDDTDRKIIKAILEGKKTTVEIAGVAGVTPRTVVSRLRKMKRMGIIKGYRMIINTRKIGIFTDKVLIKYHNLSIDREKELMNFCRTNPNITEVIKTFGVWDIELTIETETREEFRNIYITIREKFEDIIEDFDNFRVFRIYKKMTLPDGFL